MATTASTESTLTGTVIFYNNEEYVLKKNGLPAGSGLYWKDDERKQIWIRISHDGVPKSYRSGTLDVKKALAKRDEIRRKLDQGEDVGRKKVRLGELFDDYLAKLRQHEEGKGVYALSGERNSDKVENKINKHLKYLRKLSASRITSHVLKEHKCKRRAEYVAEGKTEADSVCAVNGELRIIRAAMRLGMDHTPPKVHSIPKFPIDEQAEENRARTRIVEDKDYDALVPHLAPHLKPVMPFVMYAGVREKELKFIRIEQVDLENMVIHLRKGETKNGDERDAPIVKVAEQPLREWINYTKEFFPDCPWLFHYNGQQNKNFKKGWTAALRRAGLRRKKLNSNGQPIISPKTGKPVFENLIRFHDTRRTATTVQDIAGVPKEHRMRNIGHKTESIAARYNQNRESARIAKEAVDAHHVKIGKIAAVPDSKPAISATTDGQLPPHVVLQKLMTLLHEGKMTEQTFALAISKL